MSEEAALDFAVYEKEAGEAERAHEEAQAVAGEIAPEHEMVPRATVAAMVRERDSALEAFDEAWRQTDKAVHAIEAAWARAREATRDEKIHYAAARNGPEAALRAERKEHQAFRKQIRAVVDAAMWQRVVTMTKLEILMDATAKDELRGQLQVDPPAITEENIRATIETFLGESRTIFIRGIATCFSSLDRRFRSHLGFSVGSRIILDNAFNEHGTWAYGRWQQRKRDTMIDIDRTFHVLDGKGSREAYAGIVGAIDAERGPSRMFNARQSEVESEYFKVRIYKNGNAHIWFKRDDLVNAVNGLLAEYYGETLADASNQRRENAKGREGGRSKTMAKNFGFFATPKEVAERVVHNARLRRREGQPPMSVLEPSAGTGALARRAVEHGAIVDCIEIQPQMAELLRAQGVYRKVITGDFLEQAPSAQRRYDAVVMNPPFDNGLDIDHVRHAMQFLKPEGRLVAVVSAACEFRTTHAAKALRTDIERLKGAWVDIPAGAFREAGTNVNTVMIVVNADGRDPGWSIKRW